MTLLRVRIVANAKTSEVIGKEDGAWKIRIMAPPVEGKANQALILLLADKLDLAPSEIEIVKGFSSKIKVLDVPLPDIRIQESLDK